MESNIIEGFNLDETFQPIDFMDEEREEGSAKKHKITIINQTPNQILADIEYVGEILANGTPINAEVMTKFQDTIVKNEQKSNTAIRNAHSAEIVSSYANLTSKEATDIANEANEIALNAIEKAENAEEFATQALEKVTLNQGSKIYVNQNLVESFDADSKLDANLTLQNANKMLATDQSGNIYATSVVTIGAINCYSQQSADGEYSLIVQFPDNVI